MTITKTLNKDEIAQVIANYFQIDIKSVNVIPYIGTSGYGMMEESCAFVKCEITHTEKFK